MVYPVPDDATTGGRTIQIKTVYVDFGDVHIMATTERFMFI